jgi:hypothetical protein
MLHRSCQHPCWHEILAQLARDDDAGYWWSIMGGTPAA